MTFSEFLLGENILVAPVMEEGRVSRDIYLPRGVWEDQNYGNSHTGPLWLRNYPANLSVLPYFIKNASVIIRFKISSIIIALFIINLFSRKF